MRIVSFQKKFGWPIALALLLAASNGCQSGAEAGGSDKLSARAVATPIPAGVIDLQGKPANPFALRSKKAVVLIFVRPDCPISNHYAPEIERLQKEIARKLGYKLVDHRLELYAVPIGKN